MSTRISHLILAAVVLFSGTAWAQEMPAFQPELYISQEDTLPYRILLPQHFDSTQQYPLVLFLHGAGERGKDNTAQLAHGSNLFLRADVRNKFPAVVVFPQCPNDNFWANLEIRQSEEGSREFNFNTDGEPTKVMSLLQGLIQELVDKEYVDNKKLYVGGLSMGGMGTLELLRREPKRFAAAFVISGGDNPENASKYKHVPLWLFHGSKDDLVPVQYSTTLADKLEEIGAKNIKLTLYPGVKHNSWENALAEPGLLPWLFSKKK